MDHGSFRTHAVLLPRSFGRSFYCHLNRWVSSSSVHSQDWQWNARSLLFRVLTDPTCYSVFFLSACPFSGLCGACLLSKNLQIVVQNVLAPHLFRPPPAESDTRVWLVPEPEVRAECQVITSCSRPPNEAAAK
ncbi:hypothetical protein DPMN_056882 [Dreissena polymorpha]|uniref:Uncharacterized protein n=1 Tax=Dreissena polymorpha TaxID=45954 RepID=A0A9D4CV99_DREPO|nr:hypothetical protein DPMN_056882 [Dreissena polymorpha]